VRFTIPIWPTDVPSARSIVVVGAGTAASVLVEQLSRARADLDVIVIEQAAGRADWAALDRDPAPVRIERLSAERPSERQEGLPVSATWGGASMLHGGIALPGLREDYERWEAAAGPAWGSTAASERIDRVRATSVQRTGSAERVLDRGLLSSAEAAFYEYCAGAYGEADLTAHSAIGVGMVPSATTEDGRILTAYRSHLEAALTRPNVQVSTGTRVVKLVTARDRVVGLVMLDVSTGSRRYQPADVVVCAAGALGSPDLLLSSGIGPRHELEAAGRQVVKDLPGVGRRLRDHPTTWFRVRCAEDDVRWPWHKVLCRTAGSDPDLPGFSLEAFHDFRFGHEPRNAGHSLIVSYMALDTGVPGSIRPALGGSGSSTVTLPTYRRNQEYAVRDHFRRMMTEGPMSRAGLRVGASDLLIGAPARTRSAYHFHGSCPMGLDAGAAVVDAEMRVFGYRNLFVADSSVIPVRFRANTHLVTKMIGSACADVVAGFV